MTTPPLEVDCTATFQIGDGVTRIAWEADLQSQSTDALQLTLPVLPFSDGARLLLNFQATCTTPDGRISERTRLPGLLVDLDGTRVVEVASPEPPEGPGTLIAEGPLGVFTVSTAPLPVGEDDDPTSDHAVLSLEGGAR